VRITHSIATLATIALLLICPVASGQDTIGELIDVAGLREGPLAMRELDRWDPNRKIIVRDIGFSTSEASERFGPGKVVVVSSREEARAHVQDAGAIIGYCSEELLTNASHVTWIQIYSAGAERCLGVEQVGRDNVVLTNMQKMSSPVIAEHAIAMLLALTRTLPDFTRNMADGTWPGWGSNEGLTTISGKTMLVLGLGGIGTEIAQRAAALGMRVVGTRNSSREGPDFVDYVGLADETAELARDADVIVNALPLTDKTRGMLGSEFFGIKFAQTPYFINVGRGATVDTQALLEALQAGRLAGAGLDVTDPEPLPPAHPLWQQDNVIITPHTSAAGGDRVRYNLLVQENIRRYLAGDALLNVVDPERGY